MRILLNSQMSVSQGFTQLDKLGKRVNFWQILEGKSAYSEGIIANDVLFLNHFLNLKISPNLFFATKSPLERFLTDIYLFPITTELDYIEQRVELISQHRKLQNNFDKNSTEFEEIDDILWLLRFQLYGFGQKLIADGKILYGLIALKESGVLEKETVREGLQKLAQNYPKYQSVISEFI